MNDYNSHISYIPWIAARFVSSKRLLVNCKNKINVMINNIRKKELREFNYLTKYASAAYYIGIMVIRKLVMDL